MRHTFLACFLLAAIALPTAGQSKPWKHKESGITLPDQVGDLRRGERQDLDGNLNIMVQYGTEAEPLTVYLDRAAYPNPALWFDRSFEILRQRLGVRQAPQPRSFSLGANTPTD